MPKADLTRGAINYTQLGAWTPGCAPIVLVHGLAASSAFWLRISQEISAFQPVLLYDLRGHGRSEMSTDHYSPAEMADDLAELMDFLGVRVATLAGHSFGGVLVLNAALRWSGKVEALVLADTRLNYFQPQMRPASWPNWEHRKQTFQELGMHIEDDEPEGGYRLLTEVARLQLRDGSVAQHVPQWVAELCGQAQSRFTAKRWLQLIESTPALFQFSAGPQITPAVLRKIPARILAIYGQNSPTMPSAEALRRERPDVDLRIVPNAGHFFPMTKPEAFTEPVLELLRLPETSTETHLATND
jgi:pimeloyl-ACP methyl ester carboxylesterase